MKTSATTLRRSDGRPGPLRQRDRVISRRELVALGLTGVAVRDMMRRPVDLDDRPMFDQRRRGDPATRTVAKDGDGRAQAGRAADTARRSRAAPKDLAPSTMSWTSSGTSGRRLRARTVLAACHQGGLAMPCELAMTRTSAACRLVTAQSAARTAATSTNPGRPVRMTSPSILVTWWRRTPSTAGGRQPWGTETCWTGSSKPVRPAACSALTPSTAVILRPVSHTARRRGQRAPRSSSCVQMVAAEVRHRSEAISRRTAWWLTPSSSRDRGTRTPPYACAVADDTTARRRAGPGERVLRRRRGGVPRLRRLVVEVPTSRCGRREVVITGCGQTGSWWPAVGIRCCLEHDRLKLQGDP